MFRFMKKFVSDHQPIIWTGLKIPIIVLLLIVMTDHFIYNVWMGYKEQNHPEDIVKY